ncbi:hypothetical protein [Methanogenium cariaci]|uniref:hypothetical protein n=1 Tax=Methanogenium cariaci TaxID=2197 RepID=UPI001FE1FC95|nr:hypothetical protein [Methanogenium cariaci]
MAHRSGPSGPPPAINAAVEALSGCEGKSVILFATCGGGQAKNTLSFLTEALAAKGVRVRGEFVFDKNEVENPPAKIDVLIAAVKSVGGSEIKAAV